MGPLQSVVLLGLGFLFCFLAFNGAQNLETSSDDKVGPFKLGSWSLGVLYVSNMICGLLIAAPAVSISTDKRAMIWSSLTIPVFLVANIVYPKYTLLAGSAVIGVGAGIMWTACGGYIASCSAWQREGQAASSFSGIFYGIMQLSQVFGNLASYIILSKIPSLGHTGLFVFYMISSAIGTVLLFFLPPLERSSHTLQIPASKRVAGMVRLVVDSRPMQLMVVVFIYSGLTQNFFFGIFTDWITKEREGETDMVGFVMSWFGGTDALLSFILGKLGGQRGVFEVILLASLSCGGGLALLKLMEGRHTLYSLCGCAVLYGVADAGFNSMIFSVLSTLFPRQAEDDVEEGDEGASEAILDSVCAFAAFQFFQAGVTAIAFFYTPSIDRSIQLYIFSGWLVLALLAFASLHFQYLSVPKYYPIRSDLPKPIQEDTEK